VARHGRLVPAIHVFEVAWYCRRLEAVACRAEIAGLWSATERSVEVVNSAHTGGVNL